MAMRQTISLLVLTIVGLSGCQGIGGYSAQSVTRVPPIGTNSYQVPGNYYGNAAPAPMNNGASMSNATGQLPSTTSYNGNTTTGTSLTDVATAQYDLPSTAVGSGVSTASGVASPSSDAGQLQWQR